MRLNYLLISLLAITTLISGCQRFNDLFVFRTEQKHLIVPKTAYLSLNKPQRLRPPLPQSQKSSQEHYVIEEYSN